MRARAALVLALVFFAAPLRAAETPEVLSDADVLRARGEVLAGQGRCDLAVPVFDAAAEEDRADGRASARAGRCLVALQRYPEAVERLESAIATPPVRGRARLDLVVALYHSGDTEGAARALEEARPSRGGQPEFTLYEGLVRLEQGQARESAALLASARAQGGETVEPMASFYEGVAWSRVRERLRAEEAFSRVEGTDPESPWSQRARRSMGELERPTEGGRWLQITAGGEWDTNAPLRGSHVVLPGNQPGSTSDLDKQDGFRFVWGANGGAELWTDRRWTLGAALRYAGSAYTDSSNDLDDFNSHFPVGSIWLDRRINESLVAQLQYDVGYAWFRSDSYLFPQTVTSAFYYEWGNGQTTRLFGRGYDYDYKFDGPSDVAQTPGINEARARERDSVGMNVGFSHELPLRELRSALTMGYTFHANSAKGDDWDYRAHEALATTRTALMYDFALELTGGYVYRPFLHPSTYPDQPPPNPYVLSQRNRRDHVLSGQIVLERPLTDTLTAGAHYRYTKHRSNVDPFDYSRALAGAYVTMKLR